MAGLGKTNISLGCNLKKPDGSSLSTKLNILLYKVDKYVGLMQQWCYVMSVISPQIYKYCLRLDSE